MEFTLYNYFRSSASYRVRIALNLKKIAYEYKAVPLLENAQDSAEYVRLNPSHQVPTLIHQGKSYGQSIAILKYLDEVIPEPLLFPKDKSTKTLVLQACEIINSGIQPLHNLIVHKELRKRFQATDADVESWTQFWIERGLRAYEDLVKPTAGDYSFGKQITAADLCLIPQMYSAKRFKVNLENYPLLLSINNNCLKNDAFLKAGPDCQPDTPK